MEGWTVGRRSYISSNQRQCLPATEIVSLVLTLGAGRIGSRHGQIGQDIDGRGDAAMVVPAASVRQRSSAEPCISMYFPLSGLCENVASVSQLHRVGFMAVRSKLRTKARRDLHVRFRTNDARG